MPLYGPPPRTPQLLVAKLYAPAVAVTKSAVLPTAMTAFDTTNLRNVFVVPANGCVRVKLSCALRDSYVTTNVSPSLSLGVMNGAAVAGRVPAAWGNTVVGATSTAFFLARLSVDFVVPGLTPGDTLTWDAAYAVEIASSGNASLRYGGPDDNTTNTAAGAVGYEIWST